MRKAYPKEFRDDVAAVALRHEPGVTIRQIAEDFGISETCLQNWLCKAEVEAGSGPGTTAADSAESRDLRERNRVLEQEDEVLRRAVAYLSQASLPGKALPSHERAVRRGDSRHGLVSIIEACSPAVLTCPRLVHQLI